MRQRTGHRLPDSATITRRTQDTTIRNEPRYSETTVATDVDCRFEDESTVFERIDGGERVQQPATVTFAHDVDVQEGDTIAMDGQPDDFEAVGIDETRDHRRGRVIAVTVELERV